MIPYKQLSLAEIELHLDELSQALAENQPLVLQLIEKRRRILRDRVLRAEPVNTLCKPFYGP